MDYNKVPNFLVFILAIYVIEQSSSPSIVYSGGGSSLILVKQFINKAQILGAQNLHLFTEGPKVGCAINQNQNFACNFLRLMFK